MLITVSHNFLVAKSTRHKKNMTDSTPPKNNPLTSTGAMLTREVFYDGDKLIEQGSQGNRAFYIESGDAEVFVREKGEDLKVAELGPGDIVGEMALITNAPRSATVVAKSTLNVSVISRTDMMKRLESYNDPVLKTLLDALIERLQEANLKQAEYSSELNFYQKQMIGLFDKMPIGLSVEKQNDFKKEIVPVLNQLEDILNRYKNSFLHKAD